MSDSNDAMAPWAKGALLLAAFGGVMGFLFASGQFSLWFPPDRVHVYGNEARYTIFVKRAPERVLLDNHLPQEVEEWMNRHGFVFSHYDEDSVITATLKRLSDDDVTGGSLVFVSKE